MTKPVEIYPIIPYVLEGDSYAYATASGGIPVDKKTRKYLIEVYEQMDEVFDDDEEEHENVAEKVAKQMKIDKATKEEAKSAVLVDLQTANVCMQVWERLTEAQRYELRITKNISLMRYINFCWSCVK